MASGYKEYAAYRPLLTPDQQAELARAKSREEQTELYQAFAMEAATRQMEDFGTVNKWDDRTGEKTRSDALPEEPDLAGRFPGVNPRGKYCVIDMRFAERMAAIDAVLKMRSPETGELVKTTIMGSPWFRELDRKVDELSRRHRILTRASKLCHSREASDGLYMQAKALESSGDVVEMGNVLSGVEFILGIRTGPIPEEVERVFSDGKMLDHPITADMVAAGGKTVVPDSLTFEYPSFWSKEAQLQFVKPENWGKEPKHFAPLTADELEAQAGPYARAAAERTLDAMFNACEAGTAYRIKGINEPLSVMDRGKYVIVGGKTVYELIREEYAAENAGQKDRYGSFDAYYADMGHRRAAEIVGAALTSGARVEAFIPDSLGRMPEKPLKLTQSGFEPERMGPVELTGWERFWSKFGFYSDKVKKFEEEKTFLAAHERVRIGHDAAKTERDSIGSAYMQEQFFREWKQKNHADKLPSASFYSVERSAWTTFAMLKLLNDGCSLRDILDPEKLAAEKQAAGAFVVEMFSRPDDKRDIAWEAGFFHDSAQKYFQQMDALAAQYDLADPKTYTSEEFTPVIQGILVGFDAFQEVEHIKESYMKQYGADDYETVRDQFGRYGYFGNLIENINPSKEKIILQTKSSGIASSFGNLLAANAAIQSLSARFAAGENRGKPLSEVYNEDFGREMMTIKIGVLGSRTPMELQGMFNESAQSRAALCDAVISGSLINDTRVVPSTDGGFQFELPASLNPAKAAAHAGPML